MKTLIVSDLHIGPDSAPAIYADSRALPALIAQQGLPLRVVLNGDSFDFLLDCGPLELRIDRAVSRLRQCAGSRDGSPLLAALAVVLRGGGEVLVRAGNHDLELALPEVQAELATMLAEHGAPTQRLQFAIHDEPTLIEVGPHRVLVTHGEHVDPFNRWRRDELLAAAAADPGGFQYPAGSTLVKDILNPLKARMRFLDLLKPDFYGAIMAALAIDPLAVKQLIDRSTLKVIVDAVDNAVQGRPFEFAPGAERHPLDALIEDAALDPSEAEELAEIIDSEGALSFDGRDGALRRALDKIGRVALLVYAAVQRASAGDAGASFFDERPSVEEWNEATRLSKKYCTNIVVSGHTHARRLRHGEGLSYVNTGTWIALLQLPRKDEPIGAWADFLAELRSDPLLKITERLRLVESACVIDPNDPEAAHAVKLIGEVRACQLRA